MSMRKSTLNRVHCKKLKIPFRVDGDKQQSHYLKSNQKYTLYHCITRLLFKQILELLHRQYMDFVVVLFGVL